MSKKSKHKKGKQPPSAWIADLRLGAPAPSPYPLAPSQQEEIIRMSLVKPEPTPAAQSAATTPAVESPAQSAATAPASEADEAPVSEAPISSVRHELDGDTVVGPDVYPAIPPPSRLPDSSFASADSLGSGDDVGEETQADIAPIGPTEYAFAEPRSTPPEVPAESRKAAPGAASVEHLEQQIKDLEARLDDMIERKKASPSAVPPADDDDDDPPSVQKAAGPPIPEPLHSSPGATAREVLSSDFYQRQWGRQSLRKRSEDVDEFGHDPAYEAKFIPFFDFLCKTYFRVEAEGTANIPDAGRCLIVSNHSGGPLPYDGIMLRTVLRREHARARELRWLAEDFVYYLPFIGSAMNRLGAVRACQENAERLLAEERLVAVFPEGAKGIGKLYKDRYRLQRFGRGGFIRLCLRTQTPIVPCAIVGAEEANPMLYRIEYMAKTLGIPYLPITPTFPALGPLGLLPAPTKWRVVFGEPLDFDGYGPEAADDEILVGRLAERVRAAIQGMLDRMVSARKSVWFG
jgi:1-acyl-sn-glycerol-3-phosphate acyltransferase